MDIFINTPGTYVHIRDKLFEIRVPDQEDKGSYRKHYFAAHKVRSIQLPRAAAISTDAIFLAIRNNIDILIVEHDGMPAARIWHSKLGSTTRIRKKQLEASLNTQAVSWVVLWMTTKLERQTTLLSSLGKHRKNRRDIIDEAIEAIQGLSQKIKTLEAENIDQISETLRGYEGTAGRIYFQTLSQLIPPRYAFEGRSFRPARDPFNAMLNYAYGILYGRVEKALIIAGIDPYIGFLHRDDYNHKSMVYDFIEPYRPWADEVVFKIFSTKKVRESFFEEITNGISLSAEGKPVLIESFVQFFDEIKIRYKNRNQTRQNIIQLDAHRFANTLIGK